MKFQVDGEDFEIPDEDVRDYVEMMDAQGEGSELELVPPNKFVIGLNVTHTGELDKAGRDIRSFIDTIGDGEVEVQVMVNAKLHEFKDKVVGFTANRQLEPAIGDAQPTEFDDYDDYDDLEEED